jgi:hypothetical protein
MKSLAVKPGLFALVDDDDFERVSQYRWSLLPVKDRRTFYAMCKEGAGRGLYMHRFIVGAPPELHVDHIDGLGLNNVRENLRLCPPHKNPWNQRLRLTNKSGFKGVSWNTRIGRWVAQIGANGKRYPLGCFDLPEDAARAYDDKAIELFGEFARTNAMLGLL